MRRRRARRLRLLALLGLTAMALPGMFPGHAPPPGCVDCVFLRDHARDNTLSADYETAYQLHLIWHALTGRK